MKGATVLLSIHFVDVLVSIHAPNEGSDEMLHRLREGKTFQSTLPMKGATTRHEIPHYRRTVSIHAPNEGSDSPNRLMTSGTG